MGRPSKYTAETEARIADALRSGASRRAAAAYGGIHIRQFERWMTRFAAFAATVRQAEADVEVRMSRVITDAARAGDWRAAQAWLERRRHDEWGRRDRIELHATIRQLAREHGLTPDEEKAALAEAERILREHARGE